MNEEELKQWRQILENLEAGGNDGADVYEAEGFCRSMEEKYGKPFNQLEGA
jgi:hypothetical protein